jgi:Eco57I restriction-modification methylase/TaqI-like C-terminal specificity domain
MPLYQSSVLNKYLALQDKEELSAKYAAFKTYFLNATIQQNILAQKEEQFQEGFLRELFVKVLGYTINPEPDFNLTTELKNIKDAKKADGAILNNEKVLAIIELKGTDTTNLTKIEQQAFGYKNNQEACRYVITSNFQKLRFYIDNAIEYQEWDLFKLDAQQFSLLYLCLAQTNIFADLPATIKTESVSVEENVTKQLYKEYSQFRKNLFNNIVELNPTIDKLLVFKKTQKLLDRFLFLFFAEDRQLVPPNSVRLILNQWNNLKDLDAYVPLYDRFKLYFGYLNNGHKGKQHDIFAYNGGLFAADEILDNIAIDDTTLYDATLALSNYDYNTEVDVNILGHIFEHSLTEIEELEKEITATAIAETKTSKRKKDGVFYTPKYITKYIVENTVGTLCKNKKEELQLQEEDYHKLTKKAKKELYNTLQTYKEWLLQITIIDPACGSGAFLNQALEFLIAEHRWLAELEANVTGASIVFDVETSILENNLFGVDINEESVEIAKLSLWLRTARHGRKLNSLNNNIKCGNSLIDDPAVAGDKAFNWQQEFPHIFEKGGFDVVVGNPPYVSNRGIKESDKTFYKSKYYSSLDQYDLYVLFIEKGEILLKGNGSLSFITPDKFLVSKYGEGILEYLKNKVEIESFWDLTKYNVFVDASVYPVIFNFRKCQTKRIEKYYKQDFVNKSIETVINDFDDIVSKIEQVPKTKFKVWRPLATSKNIIDGNQKVISNGEINRYIANPILNKTSNGSREYDILPNKIILKKLCYKIEAILDSEGLIPINTTYCITSETDLMFLLAILNSELITFYARKKYISTSLRGGYIELRVFQIELLPLIQTNYEQQQLLKENAEIILSKNKELQQANTHFQKLLTSKFPTLNINTKLEKWYELSFADFNKELTKQKIKLSLQDQSEWLSFFDQEKQKAMAIKNEIDATDKEIDKMVYALYELTEEEIKIVEGG